MKNLLIYFYALLLMVYMPVCAKAANEDVIFSMTCDRDTVCKGEEITFKLSAKAVHDINLSTFKLSIKFDSDKLKFKDILPRFPISDYEVKYNLNDSTVDIIFLTEDDGINISKFQEVNLLEIDFKALSLTGGSKTCVDSEIDGVGNFDEKYLYTSSVNDVFVEISQEPKFDCRLKLLAPSEGILSPDFSADVFDYTVDVPCDCNEIDFDVAPINEDASVKISRHKLKKPGEETKIKISVNSPDKNNKIVYRVNAKRESKENDGSSETQSRRNGVKKEQKNKGSRQHKSSKEGKARNKLANNRKSGKNSSGKGLKNITNSKNGSVSDLVNETSLGIDSNSSDEPNRTLVLKENGFSFIIFMVIVFSVILFLFFIWRHKKQCKNTNDEILDEIEDK